MENPPFLVGPGDMDQDALRAQYRQQEIRSYRQSIAMHVMLALVVRADDEGMKAIARRARIAADALCAEIFEGEAL